MIQFLNPDTAVTDIRQHLFDTNPVDDAQALATDPQPDPALFTFQPEPATVQIGHEAPLGLVIGMGNVVPDQWPLAGDLTDL